MKNSKSIKSRQILLSGLVALVLAAGYYRWTVDNKTTLVSGGGVPKIKTEQAEGQGGDSKNSGGEKAEDEKSDDEASEDKMGYFEKTRYEREVSRSNILSAAEDTENKEMKTAASEEIKKSEKETAIEGLVKAKGFEDCIVFLDEAGANVVVKCEKLDSASANQIKDIIISKTGLRASDIRISTKEK